MIITLFAGVDSQRANLAAYRGRTLALLRRYFRMSLDIGRLPSLLGREFFRARVTSYHMHSFEDVVILVHDVERCLQKLDDFSRTVVARVVFQDYTWDETAVLMRCSRSSVARRFPRTLDRLSEIFLEVGLLQPIAGPEVEPSCCQEGDETGISATDCVVEE